MQTNTYLEDKTEISGRTDFQQQSQQQWRLCTPSSQTQTGSHTEDQPDIASPLGRTILEADSA